MKLHNGSASVHERETLGAVKVAAPISPLTRYSCYADLSDYRSWLTPSDEPPPGWWHGVQDPNHPLRILATIRLRTAVEAMGGTAPIYRRWDGTGWLVIGRDGAAKKVMP